MTAYTYHRCCKCTRRFPDGPRKHPYCKSSEGCCGLNVSTDRPDPQRTPVRDRKRGSRKKASQSPNVDREGLNRTLASAGSDALVLDVAARIAYAESNEEAHCPADMIPDPAALDAWFRLGIHPPDYYEALMDHAEDLLRSAGTKDDPAAVYDAMTLYSNLRLCHEFGLEYSRSNINPAFYGLVSFGVASWSDHPVIRIVKAWQATGPLIQPSTRPDRILPAKIAHVAGPIAKRDARRGDRRLWTPAHHTIQTDDRQLVLPGFERSEVTGPALPIAMYNLGADGRKPGRRGRGQTVALRLFVECLLSANVRPCVYGPVIFERKLRDMLEALWPRQPMRTRNYESLFTASEYLASMDGRVPYTGPDGKQTAVQVVSLLGIPQYYDLDGKVTVQVTFPQGSGPGPVMPAELNAWGAHSAAAYCALLNLGFQWFDLGVTRVPAGKTWVYTRSASRYPLLGPQDVVRLCFPQVEIPKGKLYRWHRPAVKALRDLEAARGVKIEGEIERKADVRLMPPAYNGNLALLPPG